MIRKALRGFFDIAASVTGKPCNDNDNDNAETLFVFTVMRNDIIELTERITNAIPPHLLTNMKAPLTVSVDGTMGSGKKIVADYARRALLPQMPDVTGNKEYDEYCDGIFKGKQITVSFINVAWNNGYSFEQACGDSEDILTSKHKNHRTHTPGALFVHNHRTLNSQSDLAIWVECETHWPVHYAQRRIGDFSHRLDDHMTDHELYHGKARPRYIEVTVRNKDLLNCQTFMQELRDMNMLPVSEKEKKEPVFRAKTLYEELKLVPDPEDHNTAPQPTSQKPVPA